MTASQLIAPILPMDHHIRLCEIGNLFAASKFRRLPNLHRQKSPPNPTCSKLWIRRGAGDGSCRPRFKYKLEGQSIEKREPRSSGGGTHGAFVWGVLDRFLEDGRLGVEAISATSAGAMNAVALASGMATGGPEAARKSPHDFCCR
jgi:hypothetical protein